MNRISEVINKTVSLYSGTGWKKVFAKSRFWHAPLQEVEKLIPKKGLMLDLGCGEGIFTNFLGLAARKRNIIGIDIDIERLALAKRGVENVTFKYGDLTKISIPRSDTIILFQVIHHLTSYREQEELIEKCVKSLKPNGKIIIIEIYVCLSLQYILSWIADHFLVAWFFEKKLYSPIRFRKLEEWLKILTVHGLACKTIFPNAKYKPFSNVIIECKQATNMSRRKDLYII